VKGKVVLGMMAMIGMLALSATVAHAGGGGNPVALTSFFTCHSINGASVGTKVDVYSNEVGPGLGVPSRTNVTIGRAILACAQVFLFHAGETPTLDDNGNPTNNITPEISSSTPNELKCYTASVLSKKSGEAGSITVEDALFFDRFGLTETVPVGRDPKLICAPASVSGQ
jgi:hypothetical protein